MQLNMLEAMNIYVNVVEQGSFIRAAEVLELHRPAYSSLPLPDGIHSMTISFYMPHTKAIRVFFLTSGFHFYVLYVH